MFKRFRYLKKNIPGFAVGACLLLGHAVQTHAHDAGAVLGDSPTFVAVGIASCFDDGNGPADHLIFRIRDNSPAVPDLLTSLHVFKGNQVANTTDAISGDADYSPYVSLHQGPGAYFLIVSKTGAGERSFDVEYHCNAADGAHTGTDISVSQFGEAARR